MTPEVLVGLGGSALSLAFSYIPGLREAFAAKTPVLKSIIMALCIIGVAGLIVLISCFNLWIVVQCARTDLLEFIKLVGIALVVNQATYKLSPEVPAVTIAKDTRTV